MAGVGDLGRIKSKRKAILALLSYAIWQEQAGDHRMADAFLNIARVPNVGTIMTLPMAKLLGAPGPDFPNRIMTLMPPDGDWGPEFNAKIVTGWVNAVADTYTEVGQSVVDTLLQIAANSFLQPYIPIGIWAWLKDLPPLPPICRGWSMGTRRDVVCGVRRLEDVEILESYFLLVWSEWSVIYPEGSIEMCTAIREDLGGIGMGRHREVLIRRLDHVLGQLVGD